jgi:hypothetical protein
VGLVTVFYCLSFETSLFVASYDSHGYGGGIRPRLHTGVSPDWSRSQSQSQSQSYIATDGRSVSKSWCQAPSGAHDQIFIIVWQLRSCFCGVPSLTRERVCLLYMLLAYIYMNSFYSSERTEEWPPRGIVRLLLRVSVFCPLLRNVPSDLLPSNGGPSTVDCVTPPNVFTEPLSSNGHIRRNM